MPLTKRQEQKLRRGCTASGPGQPPSGCRPPFVGRRLENGDRQLQPERRPSRRAACRRLRAPHPRYTLGERKHVIPTRPAPLPPTVPRPPFRRADTVTWRRSWSPGPMCGAHAPRALSAAPVLRSQRRRRWPQVSRRGAAQKPAHEPGRGRPPCPPRGVHGWPQLASCHVACH